MSEMPVKISKSDFFSGKKVLIMGLGRFGGGVDAAKFAAKNGAKVIITDLAPADKLNLSIEQLEEFSNINYHLGGHLEEDFVQAEIIVANPAIPPDNKYLKIARKHGNFITSQINIFFELCPAKIIGITGSNGKSTTTALTYHLLENSRCKIRDASYENVWLGGNIGDRPMLDIIEQITPQDLAVLELSSFQIEQLAQIRKAPKIALLTNLLPNHLDRYGTFANYCDAKENMFRYQRPDGNGPAVSFFNAEDDIGSRWFEKYKNDTSRICMKFSADDVDKKMQGCFNLPGRVNLCNLAAALAVARYFDIDDETINNCLPQFKALPHRLELVADVNGIKWYNDSKATTPESAIVALEAFESPVIIAGGYDKNLPFDKLGQVIAQRAKAAILIGQTAKKIAMAVEKAMVTKSKRSTTKRLKIELADSLAQSVKIAKDIAKRGDVVVLSPACASYDMFDNFQQRGNEFAGLVRENCT